MLNHQHSLQPLWLTGSTVSLRALSAYWQQTESAAAPIHRGLKLYPLRYSVLHKPAYNAGSVLSIDCEEVENAYDIANRQTADLDWLLYNTPMEYAQLVLSEEMGQYLSGTTLHGLED